MSFSLPSLPYAYDALAPYIDAKTMEIHYSKHHQGYVNNLNKALEEVHRKESSLEVLLQNLRDQPMAIRNNAGGHYNHSLFWQIIAPNGGGTPSGALLEKIKATFGSFEDFRVAFSKEAASRFGSGWAWLCVDEKQDVWLCSTPNQDNPLMDIADRRGTPILGLDVWEHAYYLQYQNRRPEYIDAFWNCVYWPEVQRRYEEAL